jgi:hypothetical protein
MSNIPEERRPHLHGAMATGLHSAWRLQLDYMAPGDFNWTTWRLETSTGLHGAWRLQLDYTAPGDFNWTTRRLETSTGLHGAWRLQLDYIAPGDFNCNCDVLSRRARRLLLDTATPCNVLQVPPISTSTATVACYREGHDVCSLTQQRPVTCYRSRQTQLQLRL